MTGRLHILQFVESGIIQSGSLYVWDAELPMYDPSKPIGINLIHNWLQTTGIGAFGTIGGFGGPYTVIKFNDYESKVLFKMAFNVP